MTDSIISKLSLDDQGNQVAHIGPYKLTILKKLCIGASSCVAISETVFKINEQNISEFIESGSDDPTNLLLAAQACPTKAIIVEDSATGAQLWPKK